MTLARERARQTSTGLIENAITRASRRDIEERSRKRSTDPRNCFAQSNHSDPLATCECVGGGKEGLEGQRKANRARRECSRYTRPARAREGLEIEIGSRILCIMHKAAHCCISRSHLARLSTQMCLELNRDFRRRNLARRALRSSSIPV